MCNIYFYVFILYGVYMDHVSATKEIEYKYFVDGDLFNACLLNDDVVIISEEYIEQFYIAKSGGNTVRLRHSKGELDERFVLCIKGGNDEVNEVEQTVNETFAKAIIEHYNTSSLSKRRFTIPLSFDDSFLFIEVDVYCDSLTGLIIAEIEVPYEDFIIPNDVLPDFMVRKMSQAESSEFSNYALSLHSPEAANNLVKEVTLTFN